MPTELASHIRSLRVVNTHEHQVKEEDWTQRGAADVLADLFSSYERGDLIAAGLPAATLDRLTNPATGSVAERWRELEPHWRLIRHTGYGEAVRLHARLLYDMDEITAAALVAAQPRLHGYRRAGERLRLLRDVANLDHVQVDDFVWPCVPDRSGPDFFLYDLSLVSFASGAIDFAALANETGVTVRNLATLRDAMERLFEKYGPVAIAVKSQHAYTRTLRWRERDDTSADAALRAALYGRDALDEAGRLCLGDWCIARGAELCDRFNLPFKIHTGYYAGNGYMRTDRIPAGHLSSLIARFPRTKFVLMHIAYPYADETVSLVKHFTNAYVDLCWAWSIDPYTTMDFVRRFLHASPVNKLFGYGGDTFSPTRGVAYAEQARRWMTRTLQAEVDAGDLTEREAIEAASQLLRENALAVFDVEGRRAMIRHKLGA